MNEANLNGFSSLASFHPKEDSGVALKSPFHPVKDETALKSPQQQPNGENKEKESTFVHPLPAVPPLSLHLPHAHNGYGHASSLHPSHPHFPHHHHPHHLPHNAAAHAGPGSGGVGKISASGHGSNMEKEKSLKDELEHILKQYQTRYNESFVEEDTLEVAEPSLGRSRLMMPITAISESTKEGSQIHSLQYMFKL